MKPLYAHLDGAVGAQIDQDLALADDRVLVLRDLIALWKIGIEVVLAVEDRAMIDLGLEAEPGANGLRHTFAVDDGEHPRHRRVNQRDVRIGLPPERCRSPREQLRPRGHLSMNRGADD